EQHRKYQAAQHQQYHGDQNGLPDIVANAMFLLVHHSGSSLHTKAEGSQHRGDDQVNDLDAHEGGDDAAQAVDHHVPAQHLPGGHGAVLDALHGQGDQAGDDNGVEDQRGQDGAVRGRQPHDVQHVQLRNSQLEHGRDDGEVLGHVVRDGEGGQGAAGDQQLLADLHHFQDLGGVGIQVHHVGRFLGGSGAGVHGQAHVGLCQGGGVVGSVAGHGDDLALGLLLLDQGDLVLRLALCHKAVHAGFLGDGGRGQG
ncbi:2-oxoglutarate ferredoxin oxidoreductase subunit beta, partial [Dysosmobacter welbionis]